MVVLFNFFKVYSILSNKNKLKICRLVYFILFFVKNIYLLIIHKKATKQLYVHQITFSRKIRANFSYFRYMYVVLVQSIYFVLFF